MTRDEAILKAMKLLRLSQSNYPEEAAIAAQRAQEILDRYEITHAMLQDAEKEPHEPGEEIINFESKGASLSDMGKNKQRWKSILAGHLAKANGCFIYTNTTYICNRKSTLEIVGRPSDAEKVRYLFPLLCNEVERLTVREGSGCGKTWRNQFRLGVIHTIGIKLSEARKQTFENMKSEYSNNTTALVRLDQALAKVACRYSDAAQFAKKNLKLTYTKSNVRSDRGAYNHGIETGKEISINSARGSLTNGAKQLNPKP
jgi:hypothetical protein